MRRPFRPAVTRAVAWIVFGAVLMPAAATAIVGILILALWRDPGDIALGVLTLVFAVFVLAGAILAVVMLFRQSRLAREQAEFVAHVSHELRTPLASIRMYVDTLRMGRFDTPAESAEFLDALDQQTTRLSALVEQLLGFRDTGRPTAAAPREIVPAARLLGDAMEPFLHDPAASPRLTTALDPDLPDLAVAPEGFRSALSNLVRNALQYAPGSPVRVAARARDGGVAFEVADDGPGIPLADQKRIFRKFERGSATTDSGIPGLGLGLSIVRGFATAHRGRLALDSQPGRGTTFTLWLPAPGPEDRP